MCWVVSGFMGFSSLKQCLGGFVMAIYRNICLKKPEIAMNLQHQRKLMKKLFSLELITISFLLTFYGAGVAVSNTDPTMEFLR